MDQNSNNPSTSNWTKRELDLFNITILETIDPRDIFPLQFFLSRHELEEQGLRKKISADIQEFGVSHPSNNCVSETVRRAQEKPHLADVLPYAMAYVRLRRTVTSDRAGGPPVLRSGVGPGAPGRGGGAVGLDKEYTDAEETPPSSQESDASNYSTSWDKREKSEKLASTCFSALVDFVFARYHLYRQHKPGTPELEPEYVSSYLHSP